MEMADCRAAAWVATSGLLGSSLPVETLEGALSGTPNSRVIKNMKRFIKEEILADAPTAEPTVVNNIVQTDIDERKRRRRYTRQSHAETNKTMEITLSVIPMGTPVRLWSRTKTGSHGCVRTVSPIDHLVGASCKNSGVTGADSNPALVVHEPEPVRIQLTECGDHSESVLPGMKSGRETKT